MLVYNTIDKPYEYVQRQMKQGVDHSSCTAKLIQAYKSESGEIDPKVESLIKWSSGSLYARKSTTAVDPIRSTNVIPMLKLGAKR